MDMIPMVKRSLSNDVKSALYQYIHQADLSISHKLPPESQLACNFSVSRVTIRRALDDLEQEGVVLRIHGKGTFINPEAAQIKVSLNPACEFGRIIRKSGFQCRIELVKLELHNADKKLSHVLQIPMGAPILWVEKLYFADGHPAILCIDQLSADLFLHVPSQAVWAAQSTFDLLREEARRVILRDRIELCSMDIPQLCQITPQGTRMESTSVLVLQGVCYDQNNLPVNYGMSFYDTNYIRLNLLRSQDPYWDV